MEYGCAGMPLPSAGMIFIGLLILAVLIIIIYHLLNRGGKRNKSTANELPAGAAHEGRTEPIRDEDAAQSASRTDLHRSEADSEPVKAQPDRGLFDAIVSAALAEYMGPDVKGLRIRSIRRLGEKRVDRGAFTAAVSAALAEYMGPQVAGLRIRSIRQIGQRKADRGAFMAALSAALADAMGEDVQGIRILSIRKIEKTTHQTGGQYA